MSSAAITEPVHPPSPLGANMIDQWMLDPSVTFLNHGCFGARLRSVFDAQQAWRREFETAPLRVLEFERDRNLLAAKEAVGAFLGMTPANFGLVTNASDGVNAVLRSRRFVPGGQLLTTSHVYPAVRETMQFLAERRGLEYVEANVPYPIESPDQVVHAVEQAMTGRTCLLMIDHVTSPTALRLPVERLIALAADRGVDVFVDGAHAPGMLPLDVEALAPTYYTGNLHKWMCAPPGAAFLWVHPDRQADVHPTVISHFRGEGLAAEFAWQGTRDASSWFVLPEVIRLMDEIAGPGSWSRIMDHNHALATWVQQHLARAWHMPTPTPADGSMLGSMVAMPLPATAQAPFPDIVAMHDAILAAHRIEVPLFERPDGWLLRSSCQIYNTPADYERLAEIVTALNEST